MPPISKISGDEGVTAFFMEKLWLAGPVGDSGLHSSRQASIPSALKRVHSSQRVGVRCMTGVRSLTLWWGGRVVEGIRIQKIRRPVQQATNRQQSGPTFGGVGIVDANPTDHVRGAVPYWNRRFQSPRPPIGVVVGTMWFESMIQTNPYSFDMGAHQTLGLLAGRLTGSRPNFPIKNSVTPSIFDMGGPVGNRQLRFLSVDGKTTTPDPHADGGHTKNRCVEGSLPGRIPDTKSKQNKGQGVGFAAHPKNHVLCKGWELQRS